MNRHNSTNDYEYVDENKQNIDRLKSKKYIYNNNIEQESSYIDSNTKKSNENQRLIIIDKSQPLARCNVLYLGTAIPSLDQRGIDSIQEPLSKRFPINEKGLVQGIEAWLTVNKHDLQIQFAQDPSVVLYYPILSLNYCASIRYATRTVTDDKFSNGWRFVPLDSLDANHIDNTQNPPLFAITFERTRDFSIDECHCFIAKTKRAALALVQACSDAYQTTDPQQDCSKVPRYFKIDDDDRSKLIEIDNEICTVPALEHEQTLDYQINEECAGFFYKTDQVSINSWQIWEHHKQDSHRSSSSRSSSSFSSHSSHRQHHGRSVTPISDNQQSISRSQSISSKQSLERVIDPKNSPSDIIHSENTKDINTNGKVLSQWFYDISDNLKQQSTPKSQNSDFSIDFTTDDQSEKELSKEIQRLVLNDEYTKNFSIPHQEQNKFKNKHKRQKNRDNQYYPDYHERRHSNKKHRYKFNEIIHSPAPPFIRPQQFPIQSYNTTFHPQQTSFAFYPRQIFSPMIFPNPTSPFPHVSMS